MIHIEIESRLRLYQAAEQSIAGQGRLPGLVGGKFAVTFEGRLEEIDVEAELQWIRKQEEFLNEYLSETMLQWDALALAMDPSPKTAQDRTHEIQGLIDQLAQFKDVFVAIKHFQIHSRINSNAGLTPKKGIDPGRQS